MIPNRPLAHKLIARITECLPDDIPMDVFNFFYTNDSEELREILNEKLKIGMIVDKQEIIRLFTYCSMFNTDLFIELILGVIYVMDIKPVELVTEHE